MGFTESVNGAIVTDRQSFYLLFNSVLLCLQGGSKMDSVQHAGHWPCFTGYFILYATPY